MNDNDQKRGRRAFLGDAGSHLIGYLLAVLAVLPHFYTSARPRHWAVLIPLLVLALDEHSNLTSYVRQARKKLSAQPRPATRPATDPAR